MSDKREQKREKMRRSLGSSFDDDWLLDAKIPDIVRKISKTIDDEAAEIEGRVRQISSSSNLQHWCRKLLDGVSTTFKQQPS